MISLRERQKRTTQIAALNARVAALETQLLAKDKKIIEYTNRNNTLWLALSKIQGGLEEVRKTA